AFLESAAAVTFETQRRVRCVWRTQREPGLRHVLFALDVGVAHRLSGERRRFGVQGEGGERRRNGDRAAQQYTIEHCHIVHTAARLVSGIASTALTPAGCAQSLTHADILVRTRRAHTCRKSAPMGCSDEEKGRHDLWQGENEKRRNECGAFRHAAEMQSDYG